MMVKEAWAYVIKYRCFDLTVLAKFCSTFQNIPEMSVLLNLEALVCFHLSYSYMQYTNRQKDIKNNGAYHSNYFKLR